MTAPFHPRDERGRFQADRPRWYDRRDTIDRPTLLALWTCWFAFWLKPDGALGGAFILAMLVLMAVDLWRSASALRRQPPWLRTAVVGALLVGFVVAFVVTR